MLNLTRNEVSLSIGQEFGLAVEGAVAAHLLRNFEHRLFEGFGSLENVFYWRSARGNEVDFVVLHGESLLPVEVKYQSSISRFDYSTMKRSFGKGILVTKNTFFLDEEVVGIPAPLFLLLN